MSNYNIVVGVTGGIAAYKAVEVVSRLRKLGARVFVTMSRNATKLVAPMTFRTLSGNPVVTDMFEEPKQWNVEHIALAELADLFIVCPATANVIGKMYSGIADDFLTTTVIACTAPKLICPAMNHNMFKNPIVQRNLVGLRQLGYHVLEPEIGRLASGISGKGRLPEPERIVHTAISILSQNRVLEGLNILVTAGPTREWIDPVRYITNPSSGKMGYALAAAAADRGAKVFLVSGPVELEPPSGVILKKVETVEEMLAACVELHPNVDAVIGAAAPGDFRPESTRSQKIKKQGGRMEIIFHETPDILKILGENKHGAVHVGFAAETHDLLVNAIEKLRNKNLDFICANKIGCSDSGFGTDLNTISIVMPNGSFQDIGPAPKYDVAVAILDKVKRIIDERQK